KQAGEDSSFRHAVEVENVRLVLADVAQTLRQEFGCAQQALPFACDRADLGTMVQSRACRTFRRVHDHPGPGARLAHCQLSNSPLNSSAQPVQNGQVRRADVDDGHDRFQAAAGWGFEGRRDPCPKCLATPRASQWSLRTELVWRSGRRTSAILWY